MVKGAEQSQFALVRPILWHFGGRLALYIPWPTLPLCEQDLGQPVKLNPAKAGLCRVRH